MKAILLLAALSASDIAFTVENFTADRGISTIVLKVTNNGTTPAASVFIDCAFMTKDGRTLDIGKALVTDLGPGQTKFDKASIPSTDGVETAQCYVDKVR